MISQIKTDYWEFCTKITKTIFQKEQTASFEQNLKLTGQSGRDLSHYKMYIFQIRF